MGNLFVSLRNAAGALKVFERGAGVVQSNVANASTPGYAKQVQVLTAMPMDLDRGLPGGVASGGTLDLRNAYAEATVRQRATASGYADERRAQLEQLEPLYDIGKDSGLGGAINRFFQSFAALTVAPNDLAARQVVLDRADSLARSFQSMASGIVQAQRSAEQALTARVGELNQKLEEIVAINRIFREDFRAQNDPGLQARLHNLLEDVSQLAGVSVLKREDGSVALYLGGQTLLTSGDRTYPLTVDLSNPAGAEIRDAEGNPVAAQFSGGRIQALLEMRNSILPQRMAELDELARTLADDVNALLAGGVDMDGNPPSQGLFAYNSALGVARTLARTTMTARELPAADPSAPGGNGVAVRVAELAQQRRIQGYNFVQFYAVQASGVGRQVAEARESASVSRQLELQARQFREEIQRVNLDEEAVMLMQFQRAYEAAAQMIRVLDEMTQTLLGLIR
ncbi:MAG: flagellar hook-associated protein FlgK [Bryobacteraceae bacterium]|nr:flagellar hook-associated protein FlgK [Bryobacteraceae bacterium]